MVIVEDMLSAAVAERVVAAGPRRFELVGPPQVVGGVDRIRMSIKKFIGASRVVPHLILIDQDRWPCAPALLESWGMQDELGRCMVRVAVREVEAWLLADRSGFANFAGVPAVKVPEDPESIPDPKEMLLNIVRRSRKKRLAEELVPKPGSRVSIGPLYNERLSEFVRTEWNVDAAANSSQSLARLLRRLA